MFFVHRVVNAVTMMYNEADELTACHFIRPSTYWRPAEQVATKGDPEGGSSEDELIQDNDKPCDKEEPI